jgi:D-alanyl-D-alanine carboxypeptidase
LRWAHPEPAEPEASGWVYGGGGLDAPAGDIARWGIALMSGKVLGPEAYRVFSTPRTLADGRPTIYGCGIVKRVNQSGETILRHSGGDSGFVAYSAIVPRTRSAVVALSNRDDADPRDLVNDVLALLDAEHRPPPPIVAGPAAADVAKVVFAQLQSGRVDRSRLGDDFNVFLTDAKIQGAPATRRKAARSTPPSLKSPTDERWPALAPRAPAVTPVGSRSVLYEVLEVQDRQTSAGMEPIDGLSCVPSGSRTLATGHFVGTRCCSSFVTRV